MPQRLAQNSTNVPERPWGWFGARPGWTHSVFVRATGYINYTCKYTDGQLGDRTARYRDVRWRFPSLSLPSGPTNPSLHMCTQADKNLRTTLWMSLLLPCITILTIALVLSFTKLIAITRWLRRSWEFYKRHFSPFLYKTIIKIVTLINRTIFRYSFNEYNLIDSLSTLKSKFKYKK